MKKELTDSERLKILFQGKRKIDFVRAMNPKGGASMVSQHLSGHRPISLIAAKEYAEWLGVTVAEISPSVALEMENLTSTKVPGTGTTIAPVQNAIDPDYTLVSADSTDLETGRIEYWDVKGSCGGGFLNFEQMPKGNLIKEASFFRKYDLKPENAFAIYADGDSMADFICDGDLAIFDKSKTEPKSGEIYAIEHPDGLRIKTLRRLIDGTWILESRNPDKRKYPDEVIPPSSADLLKIRGLYLYRQG
ncbi:helix-turn-helix transcriptional regulator [Undibacterium sp.]|uniref:S24 family peptidase n=1 Tax=Undibacterium sp. TaxID=1914977 RepID=UPI0037529141